MLNLFQHLIAPKNCVGRDPPAFAGAASRRQAIMPLNGAFGERTLPSLLSKVRRNNGNQR